MHAYAFFKHPLPCLVLAILELELAAHAPFEAQAAAILWFRTCNVRELKLVVYEE